MQMSEICSLPFTPLLAVANNHVADCGKPPCLIDSPERKGRWAYFENQYGEQLVATQDSATGRIVVYHGDCGWQNPLTYEEAEDRLVGEDGPVSLSEPESLFFTAFLLACGVRGPATFEAD
jgi:hypothetical protein